MAQEFQVVLLYQQQARLLDQVRAVVSQRETNTRLRDPIMVRPTLSRFINTLLFFLLVIQVFPPRFPFFLKLFLLFDHLPSAYLFSAQLSGLTPGREFFYGGLASVTIHSAISPSIFYRFSQSQWIRKALEKTFPQIPVTSQSNQYWLRYQADQLVTTMVPFIKLPISQKPPQSKLHFQASEKPSLYHSE